ncbi:related to dynein intermediate chain 1, cytosolic [Serendipita indica DSM 11827]|uniref:Related to dynein intermediate chain 1, cytosolic n=1 Tax=Serendipita indica (strain DSM 11827) TaxID=1109443 RepID=G4TJ72_SERID|nr:related to dynein intermediate chain 1, cytosolic [Serendipita indica DSM 11827]
MSEWRREIDAKRAKLEAVRKAKAEKRRQDELSRSNSSTPAPGQSSEAKREREKDRLYRIISDFVGEGGSRGDSTPGSSIPSTPAAVHPGLGSGALGLNYGGTRSVSRQSDSGSERGAQRNTMVQAGGEAPDRSSVMSSAFVPDLIEMEQELFEMPQKERVVYNKEVQTAAFDEDSGPTIEELRQQLRAEYEQAQIQQQQQREKELEEEAARLDQEIEQEIRELTEEERATIFAAPEFFNFVEQSSKIIQRALNDNYDYTRDYTVGAQTGEDESEGKRVKKVCAFWDERWCKNRSITDIDWSPRYPELSVAAYNKNPAGINEPDGIVAVWNQHLLERPEFVFHSQSDVLSVLFSPFHSNLIFGGTYSGQILLWDTRARHLPVLKTPLSAAGHTYPVYAMQMVGTQNAHNLITSSTDGMVYSWLVDMLAQPQEALELVHTGHNKTDEVAITTLDFPDNETTTFWVGTEEGNVYQANRYDRAGSKAGLNQHDVYKGHNGPVTGLHFHPLAGPVDFSDLFLTCSVDWTVKLWRAKVGGKPSTAHTSVHPLYSFNEADDYVYDVKWHPQHPALFGSVDGAGRFDLWNLNVDTEVPTVSTVVGERAINKMEWDKKDGRRVALGSSDGRLYVYDIGDLGVPRESEWTDLQKTLGGLAGANAAQLGLDGEQSSRTLAGR